MSFINAGLTPNGELVLMDWEAFHNRPVALEFDRLIRPFCIGSDVHQAMRHAYSHQFQISPELFDRQLYLFNLIGSSRQLLSSSTQKDPQKRQNCLGRGRILLKAAERFAQAAQHCSRQIPSDAGIVSRTPARLPSLPQV